METTLVADATAEHHFVFKWLGTEYRARVNATSGSRIVLDGEWFNEGASVTGYYEKPDGTKVENEGGISEVSVKVVKSNTI